MRRVIIVLLCLSVGSFAYAQQVDLSQMDVSRLDLTKADLSDAEFYFAGPVDLLVRGIEYMGAEYAALLKYDGRGNVEVAVPSRTSASGLPHALDVSEIRLSLGADGIRVSNVIADGFYFSGKLIPQNPPMLAVSPDISMGGVAGAADLADDVTRLQTQIRDLRSNLAEARSGQRSVQDELSDAQNQIASLESRLQQADRGADDPLARIADLQRTVKSGFGGGSSLTGSWSLSGTRLRQTASDQLFAKYGIPARQNSNELVYTFEGSGSSEGWSGYGMHFLASSPERTNLYGFGSSYLIWITRDPRHTQSEDTFVQLYRSYDDVRMVQIASKAIARPITSTTEMTIYVNRGEGSIVVAAEGNPVFTFEDPNIIRSGAYIVPRALGPATLSGLSVRSR